MKRVTLSSALVLGAIFVASAVIRADYKDDFVSAIKFFNQKNWAEAIKYFDLAIAKNPTETRFPQIIISGGDVKPYLPHYYLSLALQKANNCVRALNEWKESEAQGASRKALGIGKLEQLSRECQVVIAGTLPASSPEPVMVPAVGAEKTGQVDKDSVKPPTAIVEFKPGTPDWGSLPGAEPRPAIGLSNGPTGPPHVTPPIVDPLLGLPPRVLVNAAQLFFNARYQQALSGLEAARYATGPEAVQTFLFRAAASYALYLLGRELDDKLLQEAARNVRLCKRVDPQFKPNSRAFSPRFLDFFISTN